MWVDDKVIEETNNRIERFVLKFNRFAHLIETGQMEIPGYVWVGFKPASTGTNKNRIFESKEHPADHV
jgi:hypothetical protein